MSTQLTTKKKKRKLLALKPSAKIIQSDGSYGVTMEKVCSQKDISGP